MLILYVIISMSIALVFMFKIEWLYNKKTAIALLFYTIVLVVLSFLLKMFAIDQPKNIALLTIPLISLLFFCLAAFVFKKIYKRNPENTFWESAPKPVEDVIFTIIFWVFGVGIPYLFIKTIENIYT